MLPSIYTMLLFLTGGYVAAVLWLWRGLHRLAPPLSSNLPHVSIVVAARNEESHMAELLSALLGQDYPQDRYEIVIVDDGSEDATAAVVREFQLRAGGRLVLLQAKNRENAASPKKNALAQGIAGSRGEIILLTDADCVPPPGWLRGMTAYFTAEVGLVAGFSPLEIPPVRGIGAHLLALDSLSLAAVAAGSAGRGLPATCSGRNLAYRLELYRKIGGFEEIKNIRSGDDDMLLMQVRRISRWRVGYAYDPALAVPTRRPPDARTFIHQRLRHASKGFAYEWREVMILALVYLYNLLLIFALSTTFFFVETWSIPWLALALKSAAEWHLLNTFATRMRRRRYLRSYPLAILLHPIYVVLFGALGNIVPYRWKPVTMQ